MLSEDAMNISFLGVPMRTQVRSLASLTGLRIGVAMSCGAGCRLGSDPALLWLWCRQGAIAPIWLAWEPPYALGAALKRQKKKKYIISHDFDPQNHQKTKLSIKLYVTIRNCWKIPIHFQQLETLFIYFWGLFGAVAAAYGSSQASSPMGAAVAGLRHSHSSTGFKLHLQPKPEPAAMPDP